MCVPDTDSLFSFSFLAHVTAYDVINRLPKDMELHFENPNGFAPDFEKGINDYLNMLSSDYPNLLNRNTDRGLGGGQYSVNFTHITEVLRQTEVEDVIHGKMGGPSVRIWRMVLDKGKMDDRLVAKIAMMAPKETRERLYALFKGRFLFLQVCCRADVQF